MNVRRLTHGRRKEIATLRHKKVRDETGLCLVEGRRAVEAAVIAGASVRELVVTDQVFHEQGVGELAKSVGIVQVGSKKDLERVSDVATSQGILAVVESRWSDIQSLNGTSHVVFLDGLQDPGNVGTIIRTAAWFGIDAIVCGPGVADCYGPKVLRASMGGVWDLRLVHSESTAEDLRRIQSMGFDLYVAHLEGEPVASWAPVSPSCLILGSEAHGPSIEVLALPARQVRIPRRRSSGATESLNVAVAAGILMFRWTLA